MNVFTKRNLKLFFRDRSAVFFSLMAILVIIVLYAAFLGDVWLPDSMQGLLDDSSLIDSWLVSGLLAVASVTTTMGAFGVMIDDRVKKIDRDFCASPFPKSRLTAGYLGSAFYIGTIMSVITFAAAELYIVLRGGDWLAPVPCLKMLLLIFLSTMANTSVVCFIVSFFQSQHAFSTASTIIGTAIGFLSGIYLPIGSLPSSVQTVIKLFPVSYSASLFRQILMRAPMKLSFEGVPAQYLNDFREYMGVTYRCGGHEISPLVCVLILMGTAIVFYALSVVNLSKKS
ncbi:ABC transporter permease protein [Oscillibacter valericigenes Sjm18-20]|nr:ABC transporter permease protein [Oscillibacter valericigenes Sjm18-20]